MIADGHGGYPETFVPHAASEPNGHAAPTARPRSPPPGGAGQNTSGGAFGDLLDSVATPAADQPVPATDHAPPRGDKSAATPPAKHEQAGSASGDATQTGDAPPGHGASTRGKAVGDGRTADKSTAVQSKNTSKTTKSCKTEKPSPSDHDKTDDEADKASQDNGKPGIQPAGGSPVAAAVAGATPTAAQAGTPHAPDTKPSGAAAGDALKSALTPLSVLQATHGSAAGSQTPDAKHQTPSNGVATSGLGAMGAPAGTQADGTDSKTIDGQAGSQKGTDANASAQEHAGARDALHRLMPADASDTNKNDPHAATAKTAVQASTPLPTTTPPPQTTPTLPPAPAQQAATPATPPVLVPLAGVPIAIVGKALAGKNHFEIRLDPPELGRIDVRLDVDKDGRITSHVIADRKDTLNLLQRDASGLQRALQNAGLKTADSGLQFSLRDQWGNGNNSGQQSSSGYHRTQIIFPEEAARLSQAAPRVYGRFFSRAGGIDIRV